MYDHSPGIPLPRKDKIYYIGKISYTSCADVVYLRHNHCI